MSSSVAGQDELRASAFAGAPAGEKRHQRSIVLIVVLWATIYLPGLFTPPLLDDADSVHAEAAREMVVRHDWVTLHANGVRYLEKAPLLYWSMAASFKLFGVSEWSARLPLTLGILALLLTTYALGKRAYGGHAGLYAAVILATGFGPYIFTRILIPDLLVGLWLALGLLFFLRAVEDQDAGATRSRRLDCWGFAATCALNVLTKGLIGLVFPLAMVGVYLILTRDLRRLAKLHLASSAAIFFLIAAPWHILAGLANPAAGAARGFFWFYFINEHFLRYLNKRVPRDYDTVPLAVFWGLVLAWLLPWSAFIVQAAGQIPHKLRDYAARLDARQRASLLFALWVVVIVGFFSFSTRQEYYTVPALPGLSLLIGGWLARESDAPVGSPLRRSGRISATVLLVIGVLAFVTAMLVLRESAAPPAQYDLADLLKKNPEEYALSFGHIFDLTPQAMGAFRLPLALTGIALLLGTGANWLLRRRGAPGKGNAALAIMMVVVLACAHRGLVIFSPVLTSKPLALAIKKVYRPGDVIVIDGEYESGSTLNFYTGQQVHVLNGVRANLWYGAHFPDAPRIFDTNSSFERMWAGPARVFLFSENEKPKALEGKAAHVFARYGGKTVFINRL